MSGRTVWIVVLLACLLVRPADAFLAGGVGKVGVNCAVELDIGIDREAWQLKPPELRKSLDDALKERGFGQDREAIVHQLMYWKNKNKDARAITLAAILCDPTGKDQSVLKVTVTLAPRNNKAIYGKLVFGAQTAQVIQAHEAGHRASDKQIVADQRLEAKLTAVQKFARILAIESLAGDVLHSWIGTSLDRAKEKKVKQPDDFQAMRKQGKKAAKTAQKREKIWRAKAVKIERQAGACFAESMRLLAAGRRGRRPAAHQHVDPAKVLGARRGK